MAGKEISQLLAAAPLSGLEVLPGDQQGKTVAITAQNIANLAAGASQTVAGGDVAGTIPVLNLSAIGSATGPVGNGTTVPVVTIDTKGRVTALTSTAISVSGADKLGLTPTVVKTANYTAVVGDLAIFDTTSGSLTCTLPTAPADGSVIAVKTVIKGGSNTLTVTAGGSDVFNKAGGSTSLTLSRVLQSILLQYRASGAIWYVVTTDPALVIGTDVQAWGSRLDTFAAATDTGTGNYVRATSPALTTPTGIVATDIASGTFAIGRIPTGTTGTTVPLGGVITGASAGDASHSLAITYNAAGQLTAVTANSIAIAASQVTSGLSGTYAPLASPTFTGTVVLPAATVTLAMQVNAAANSIRGNNTGSAAVPADLTVAQTKSLLAIAESDVTNLTSDLALKAPLASPTFTGTVTIPGGASISGFAPLASPTFTGTAAFATMTATGTLTGATNVFTTDSTYAATTGTFGAFGVKLVDDSFNATLTLARGKTTGGFVATGDTLGTVVFQGANISTSTTFVSGAAIRGVAEEAGSTVAHGGARIELLAAPIGSATAGIIAAFDSTKALHLVPTYTSGLVTGSKFAVKNDGSIWIAPSAYTSNQPSAAPATISAAGAIATSSSVLSSGTAGVGYATGAGGTVTQATSRVTTVVLNKVCGTITLFTTTLAADTDVSFTLTNSTIAATDVLVFNIISGAAVKGGYSVNAIPAAGSATITVHNHTPTITASEAPVIAFAVIKGVTA